MKAGAVEVQLQQQKKTVPDNDDYAEFLGAVDIAIGMGTGSDFEGGGEDALVGCGYAFG